MSARQVVVCSWPATALPLQPAPSRAVQTPSTSGHFLVSPPSPSHKIIAIPPYQKILRRFVVPSRSPAFLLLFLERRSASLTSPLQRISPTHPSQKSPRHLLLHSRPGLMNPHNTTLFGVAPTSMMPSFHPKISIRKGPTPRVKVPLENVWDRTLSHLGFTPLTFRNNSTSMAAAADGMSSPTPYWTSSGKAKADQLTIFDLPLETKRFIFSYVSTLLCLGCNDGFRLRGSIQIASQR